MHNQLVLDYGIVSENYKSVGLRIAGGIPFFLCPFVQICYKFHKVLAVSIASAYNEFYRINHKPVD